MVLLGLSESLKVCFWLAFILAVLIAVPYFLFFGGAERFCRKSLFQKYDGLDVHETQQPGDVQFVYHTYRGLFLWFIQEEHRVSATPEDARTLLGRLLRFNLSYGLLSYGLVFVPFLAVGNYITQLRSVNKQADLLGGSR